MLDLDALALGGDLQGPVGGCALPEGSWRAMHEGYEEVHVPAVRHAGGGAARVAISALPDWCQCAFPNSESLNAIQSEVKPFAFGSDGNMLLCAPTGAGKTNCAMLCILRVLANHRRAGIARGGAANPAAPRIDLGAFKIVYVAPMKALVQEVVLNLGRRLAPLGVRVRELSGDASLSSEELRGTQVIVSTPEKWDVVTRKADRPAASLVRLLILDEVHLLHDERGPALEALVARSLRQSEASEDTARLVGLSATLPNHEDVAAFLRVGPAGLFHFDHTHRPVPLQQQFVGVTERNALKRHRRIQSLLYDRVAERVAEKQVLVFVHSRKDTLKTAAALLAAAAAEDRQSLFAKDTVTRKFLQSQAQKLSAASDGLKPLLAAGLGAHHAGMPRADRSLVEDLFAAGEIRLLVSTATLAWGVNLPAHTVVLKGTEVYDPEKGAWAELSPMDVTQMLGRAGRPQFDQSGEGIILTNHAALPRYLSLLTAQAPVESRLLKKLPDMLNAEVAAGGVASVGDAAGWIGYTYLYVRMRRSPGAYGVPAGDLESDPGLLKYRSDLAHAALTRLEAAGLVEYNYETGEVRPTEEGVVASHYYVSYRSMLGISRGLRPHLAPMDVLRLFSRCEAFRHVRVRPEELPEVRDLSLRCPIPVREALDEGPAKVNVLLQAHISRLRLEGSALSGDRAFVRQSAARLLRAFLALARARGWAPLSDALLSLCVSAERRYWAPQSPLRQLDRLPEAVLRRLERRALPWERVLDLDPRALGALAGAPPLGRALHRLVHLLPALKLEVSVQPVSRALLRVSATLHGDFVWDEDLHGAGVRVHLAAEDGDGERLLHSEVVVLRGVGWVGWGGGVGGVGGTQGGGSQDGGTQDGGTQGGGTPRYPPPAPPPPSRWTCCCRCWTPPPPLRAARAAGAVAPRVGARGHLAPQPRAAVPRGAADAAAAAAANAGRRAPPRRPIAAPPLAAGAAADPRAVLRRALRVGRLRARGRAALLRPARRRRPRGRARAVPQPRRGVRGARPLPDPRRRRSGPRGLRGGLRRVRRSAAAARGGRRRSAVYPRGAPIGRERGGRGGALPAVAARARRRGSARRGGARAARRLRRAARGVRVALPAAARQWAAAEDRGRLRARPVRGRPRELARGLGPERLRLRAGRRGPPP